MKGTDRELFLRHQRRCVKCRRLAEVRKGVKVSNGHFTLLLIHEANLLRLYRFSGAYKAMEGPPVELPTQ